MFLPKAASFLRSARRPAQIHQLLRALGYQRALYMKADPLESRNLISSPEHRRIVDRTRERLFKALEKTGGMYIRLKPNHCGQQNLRRKNKS